MTISQVRAASLSVVVVSKVVGHSVTLQTVGVESINQYYTSFDLSMGNHVLLYRIGVVFDASFAQLKQIIM